MSSLHFGSKRALGVYALLLLACSFLLPIMPQAQAAVGLVYFRAERGAGNSQVKVSWQTETEQDLVAFRVKRNTSNDATGATAVNTQQAQGSATSGGTYTFDDDGLAPGQYYYWLYEVNSSGAETMVQLTTFLLPTPTAVTNTPPATPGTTQSPPPTNTQQPTTTPTATSGPTNTPQQRQTQPTDTPPAPTDTPFVPTNTPAGNNVAPVPTATPLPTDTPVPAASDTTPATSPTEPSGASQETGTRAITPEAGASDASAAQGGPVVTEAIPAGAPTLAQDATMATPVEQAVAQPDEATAAGSTPTGQAVAQAAPAATQATGGSTLAARPTATPRPSAESAQQSNTSSLLMVIGGGSLCGAVLLVLVGVFVWRRR